ncbi:LysR family transcriptional regulator [Streptomyces ovatisporus]|uniref:LysR family transcriptional regulator n=1 Tax=Streptomyces ovatisporus TaxID=1128682 RepID=A0ABV9A2Z4_9ACTN
MLDVQQLTVLVSVARAGSYTAAARSLGCTQPAVSYRMRSLERAVGLPLVVKEGRGMRLTSAGRQLAERAEKVLAALRSMEGEFGGTRKSGGRIRTASVRGACLSLLAAAVARFRTAEPEVEVTLGQLPSADAYRLLCEGRADLALVSESTGGCRHRTGGTPSPLLDGRAPEDVGGAGLLRFPLLTERPCVLLPSAHPLTARSSLSLAELSEQHWILRTGRSRFLDACADAGFEPRVAATTDEQAVAHELVAEGAGIALAHGLDAVPCAPQAVSSRANCRAAEAGRGDSRVTARRLEHWPDRCVSLLLTPDSTAVPPVTALVAAVRTEATELLARAGEPEGGPGDRTASAGPAAGGAGAGAPAGLRLPPLVVPPAAVRRRGGEGTPRGAALA